jgi:hypothetical protein
MQFTEQLDADILARELKAGDAYMNAAGVARKLHVNAPLPRPGRCCPDEISFSGAEHG